MHVVVLHFLNNLYSVYTCLWFQRTRQRTKLRWHWLDHVLFFEKLILYHLKNTTTYFRLQQFGEKERWGESLTNLTNIWLTFLSWKVDSNCQGRASQWLSTPKISTISFSVNKLSSFSVCIMDPYHPLLGKRKQPSLFYARLGVLQILIPISVWFKLVSISQSSSTYLS